MNLFELANDITLLELRQKFLDNGYNALPIKNNAVHINKLVDIRLYSIYISQSFFTVSSRRKGT